MCFFPIKSTTFISPLYFALISFIVSMTMWCWECFGVRKKTVQLCFRVYSSAGASTEIVFPSPFREAVDPLVVDVVHQWILFLIEYGTVYAGIENLEEIITRQTERNPILTAEGFDLQALDDLTTIFLMDASDLERERTLHPTELDCLIALRELVEPETPACQGRLAMAGIRGAKALRATTRASLKL